MSAIKVWVNIFTAPYTRSRFYFSQSYPTKKKAIDGIQKRMRSEELKTRYVATIMITLDKYEEPNHEIK